jgi:hypothetical protein
MSGRCKSCNCLLTSFEGSLRASNTNELVMLCSHCIPDIEHDDTHGYYGNEDLLEIHDNITLSEN